MDRAHVTLASLTSALALAACNSVLGITSGTGAGGATTTSSVTTTTGGASTGGNTTSSTSVTTTTSSTSSTSTTSSTSSTSTTTTSELDAGDGGDGAPPVSLEDCVLLLHLDETSWSGTDAVIDSSGNGNDGTAVGTAAPTPSGKIGGAGLFDGNGYVSVLDSPTLHGPFTALTYAAWVYPTGLGVSCNNGELTFGGIVAKRTDYTSDVAFTMFLWANGAPAPHLYADLEGTRLNPSNATFANAQWYHLAVVFDGTQPATSNATLYVNGVADGPAQAGPASIGTHSSNLTIGDLTLASYDPCERFVGKIDEVAVWTRALTAKEIQTLYETTTGL